jgi:hypothetical protein
MMRVRPEYFSWLAERQDRYGVATPHDDSVRLAQVLLKELTRRGEPLPETSLAAAVAAQSPTEQPFLDQIVLPLVGIGEDEFHFDEVPDDGKTILDFDTLRQFDEAGYEHQTAIRRSVDPEFAATPYRGTLYLNSARLRLDGRFTYATLTMVAGYVYSHLSNCSRQMLQAHIPFRYVRGRNHGKVKGGFWRWDMRLEAGGQESLVEELQQLIWDYEKKRFDALLTENDECHCSGVYLVDESTPAQASVHFVFADKSALSRVRFRSFVRDCRAMQRQDTELAALVRKEKDLLARFIDEQYSQISKTVDPKVTKVRRIHKVAMTNRGARRV